MKSSTVISKFMDKREYGKHEGVDLLYSKGEAVFSAFKGTLHRTYKSEFSGNSVIVKSNFRKDLGIDIDGNIYLAYLHLHNINPKKDYFKGDLIGTAGNTGTCFTSYSTEGIKQNTFRKVSKEEQDSLTCSFGVHLHLSTFIFEDEPLDFVKLQRLNNNYTKEKDYFIKNSKKTRSH